MIDAQNLIVFFFANKMLYHILSIVTNAVWVSQ